MKINLFKTLFLTFPILLASCEQPTINVVYLPKDDGNNFARTFYKKVFILAGQSNASGVAHNSELQKKISTEEYSKYENGFNNVLISYNCDTVSSSDFVSTKLNQGCAQGTFGPELGFGEYCSTRTDDTIYVIKYARGGTELNSQWLDGKYNRGYLYNELIQFVTTQMNKLNNAKITGFMWMQGETDSCNNLFDKYYDNQVKFISYLREDLKTYIQPNGMVFADAGIADNWNKYYLINNTKIEISNLSDLNVYFSTSENGMRNDQEPENNIDRAHYDSLSELKLGQSFGQVLKQKLNEILK